MNTHYHEEPILGSINFAHKIWAHKLFGCLKEKRNPFQTLEFEHAEKMEKDQAHNKEINTVQGTWGEGKCKKQTNKNKNSKKRNVLPPAGLADLDPGLWEQNKGQSKSGLKDNNTIQKSACNIAQMGLFTNTLAKAVFPRSCAS